MTFYLFGTLGYPFLKSQGQSTRQLMNEQNGAFRAEDFINVFFISRDQLY